MAGWKKKGAEDEEGEGGFFFPPSIEVRVDADVNNVSISQRVSQELNVVRLLSTQQRVEVVLGRLTTTETLAVTSLPRGPSP